MLWLESGGIFAVGNAGYSLFPSDDPKLGVRVEIDGIEVWAVVDTGSPFLICSLELAAQINSQAWASSDQQICGPIVAKLAATFTVCR